MSRFLNSALNRFTVVSIICSLAPIRATGYPIKPHESRSSFAKSMPGICSCFIPLSFKANLIPEPSGTIKSAFLIIFEYSLFLFASSIISGLIVTI